MDVQLAYTRRTQVTTTFESSALDFAANIKRLPVAFHATVDDPYRLRQLLVAVRDVVISDYTWEGQRWVLDPVITVHPDELFFEAFSQDESAYVRLSAAMSGFTPLTTTQYGTTNIDFTQQLHSALLDMRSSRETQFSVNPAGFGVATALNEAALSPHFEDKVDLPDSWVRGFLQVQAALMMKPFTFRVHPADLLSAIHYLLEHHAKRPPKGMRYVFQPGDDVRVILEPWEETIRFYDSPYEGYERIVRVWGRKRLELLQRVLPYAESVTIGVLGRGLPHFYICHCGAYDFMLVLSGWVDNKWSQGSGFDALQQTSVTAEDVATVHNVLTQHLVLHFGELESHTQLSRAQLEAALLELCKTGHVIYDPVAHRYRNRELFAETLDAAALFAPSPREERARALVAGDAVTVERVFPSPVRQNETRLLATVEDDAQSATHDVLVSVDRDVRVRFAQCTCDFFQEHIMSQGPCEHILAARLAGDAALQEAITLASMES